MSAVNIMAQNLTDQGKLVCLNMKHGKAADDVQCEKLRL